MPSVKRARYRPFRNAKHLWFVLGEAAKPAQHAAGEIDRDVGGAEVGSPWHCTTADWGEFERTSARLPAAQSRAVALRASGLAH